MNVCISAVENTLLRMWHPRARVHAALDIQIRTICHLKLWNFKTTILNGTKEIFNTSLKSSAHAIPQSPKFIH